jgi:hypothetical protein
MSTEPDDETADTASSKEEMRVASQSDANGESDLIEALSTAGHAGALRTSVKRVIRWPNSRSNGSETTVSE